LGADDWLAYVADSSGGGDGRSGASPAPQVGPGGDGARPTWLEVDGNADPASGDEGAYVPWPQRRGPAYPGDFWHSMGRDAKEMPLVLWDDTKAIVASPPAWVMILGSGAAGISLNAAGVDDAVEHHYNVHGPQLNSFWDQVGDYGGHPGAHFAVAGLMYAGSLYAGDTKTYEVSKSLISALSINGVFTMGLKAAARTRAPNGDGWGWPSGHTSSSFTFAAVMTEHYGPWVGAPLYAFAGYVGYQRIDTRVHDFSDVISGALIGAAIGHVVAGNHEIKVLGMDVLPWQDPRREAVGVMLVGSF
jgi:hypothetical protein